jgi:DHA1 family inner membrane transport protein
VFASVVAVPLAVFVLGLTVFCVGTTEVLIAGLLPLLSADLDVSVPTVGLLISGYALGVVIGGPLLTVALLKTPKKTALAGLIGVFVLGQTLGALAPSYPVLMAARVVTALAQGAFFGIGTVVAVQIAGPEARAKALAIMFGGLTMANVIGVPIGTFIGQHLGWRASFWAVDALAALSLVGILLLVPRQHEAQDGSIRKELAAFRKPRVWSALAVTAFSQAGLFATVSYLAPLLIHASGFDASLVPLFLCLFGVGCLAGTFLGGRFADRHLRANLHIGLIALSATLALLALTSSSRIATPLVLMLMLCGVAAFSINPALQAQVVLEADEAPTLAATTNTSAFNVGNTVGPWLGGLVIGTGLGYAAPAWVGALLALGALTISLLTPQLAPRAAAATS